MTATIVHRPARTHQPAPERPARTMEPPPALPDGKQGSAGMALLPMVGVCSSVVMMTVIRNSQFAVLGALVLVVAVLGGLVLFLSQRGKGQRRRRQQREQYLAYLEDLRVELAAQERQEGERARLLDPPPYALPDLVRDPARLWERRRTDSDCLRLRLGTGEVPVQGPVIGAHQGSPVLNPPDPFMRNEALALARRHATATDRPVTAALDRAGDVSIVAPDRADGLRVLRVLLAQLVTLHAPDDVHLALVAGESEDWEWLKWLPHLGSPHRVAPSTGALAALLRQELRQRAGYAAEVRRGLARPEALGVLPRLVVVHDTHGTPAAELPRADDAVTLADSGVTVLHLVHEQIAEPGEVSVRLTVDGDALLVEDLREGSSVRATLDAFDAASAQALARSLAPLRLSPETDTAGAPLSGSVDFLQLLGIEDAAEVDLDTCWAPRTGPSYLRVPIGLGDDHEPVLLDLKESADLGMGPHGLCVGATGSGKSELLRTLVLALTATHGPEDLAMVLVDYKGGATFAPFSGLPHVAGIITNLENDSALVERVHTSLAGEVRRRQQVLKDAGNIADIAGYAAARASRPELPPLPHLFVVIDEFGELLTAKPDFIDLFLSIGRIGRSIGVHLLLSSQRIEGGKLKGLETYLSYRIGLRTFSADESRTVLETTDAFHLPPLPGFGYLKVDTSVYTRFKAGYVSGAYTGPVVRETEEKPPGAAPYVLGPSAEAPEPEDRPAAARSRTPGPTDLSVLVDQLRAAPVAPVAPIWLPPLPSRLALDAAAGGIRSEGALRLGHCPRPLRVPLGLLDDPSGQRQSIWELDLAAAGGHIALTGGPQTGKSTLLRTMVLSLALTHTPQQVGVYGLDLAGGGLQTLEALPHTGGIAGRHDRERAARVVAELRAMLAEREELFRVHGFDSVDQLRARRAAGELPQLDSTDIVLVVDGFGALREDFEELEDGVTDLLRRGGGYGLHVVAGLLRWNEIRIATQSAFGTRLELRLNDPGDSGIDRKLAETLDSATPGRVLTEDKLFAQAALPRIDGAARGEDLPTATESAVRAVAASWPGAGARAVRMLPRELFAAQLPDTALPALGLEQSALAPATLDLFGADQHLLVLGDSASGRTNLLRHLAAELMRRHGDEELVFAVMDPRRGLRGLVPDAYEGGYAHTGQLADALATGVAKELSARMPQDAEPPDLTGRPRIVVLADDYDVLTAAGQQPLTAFLPFLPSAADIGLHFVLTRRVAGAARALYEPFLLGLRESGATTLVLSGDRAEGQLVPGVYASAQPPGRGVLVRRGGGSALVQTALADAPGEGPR